MTERNFRELLEAKWSEGKFVCVGLDSEFKKIPESAHRIGNQPTLDIAGTIVAFNHAIIEATHDLVCAYKPNMAFYEAQGIEGLSALHRTIINIRAIAPDVPIILDAKRADIGNTNNGYVQMAFEYFHADAITVHPYLGQEALQPFLDCKDKGIFVMCRTSNKGAGEFQDLCWKAGPCNEIGHKTGKLDVTLFEKVAHSVATKWNGNGNCGLVVGATYPAELGRVRQIVGDMTLLVPGIGTQGGDVEATVKAGRDSRGKGVIMNTSSAVIFASNGPDFPDAARKKLLETHQLVNQSRE